MHTEQKSLTEEEAEPGTGSSTQTATPAPVSAQACIGLERHKGCPGYTAPKRSQHADGALHTEHRWCFVLHIHPSSPAAPGCRHQRLLGQRPSLHGCMNSAENERRLWAKPWNLGTACPARPSNGTMHSVSGRMGTQHSTEARERSPVTHRDLAGTVKSLHPVLQVLLVAGLQEIALGQSVDHCQGKG